MKMDKSPFGEIKRTRIIWESDCAVAFLDNFPVSKGHTLVIPKRVVKSLYDLPVEEQADLWEAVSQTRGILIERYNPDAFNIGVNDGVAAGQTIAHAHIHIIPRHKNDQGDPRGGIRWIFPDKANYWD